MMPSDHPRSAETGETPAPIGQYALVDEQALDGGWWVGKATVVGPRGERLVDAMRHEQAPGLIVTSCSFGLFEVTHAATGKRVIGHFERMGNAAGRLASLSKCVDWSQPHETILSQLATHGDEPAAPLSDDCYVISNGEKRAMTKRELFESSINWILADEFPWESSEDDPFEIATRELNGEPQEKDDIDDDA